jgi:3'(2'), 5'-bisphosphate nucleotidase
MLAFEKYLLEVSNLAIIAGNKIMDHYQIETKIMIKEDQSPLTKADLDSNNIIFSGLQKIDHSIPIISEESLVDWQIRKEWKKYWLIDPLDGTKEFINKNGEFTVNIALIENNTPVLGVIFAPAISKLYYASKNFGSFTLCCNKFLENLDKSSKNQVNKKKESDHLFVIGSRSHSNKRFDKWLTNNILNYDLIKRGSSLKFCNIAEGYSDLYPRFGPTNEWDIAAGHIILIEAGGSIYSTDNNKIVYNSKESMLNPDFIASGLMINE